MGEQLTYHLDQVDGPLDLLVTLIAKNKVSITDIPIVLICDQYMEYIEQAQKMDPDIASEFIVMASELMLIKSRMILPHEEGTENDPRREIANALLLYQQAKLAAKELMPRYDRFKGRMAKETDAVPPEKGLPLDLDPALMLKALQSVLRRIKVAEAERKPSELVNPLIKHHVVSVEEKIDEMVLLLEEVGEATLYTLLESSETRAELVARFMGILEMIKIHRIEITNVTYTEESADYEDCGLRMSFRLNESYVAGDISASEFDAVENRKTTEGESE